MTNDNILRAWHDHNNAIYQFAWRMTGSTCVAEDVLQEVFLALVRAPDRYDNQRAPLRAFLLAVARNQVRKRWEKDAHLAALDDNDDAFVVPPLDPMAGQIADLVGRAVQQLPPLQREALILFEYESLSLEEIADMTHAEVGAVKSRLSRARNNLRLSLAHLRGTNRGGSHGSAR